jgi:hypothetical protein
MAVENMPDERLLCFYENIRQQVEPIGRTGTN